MIKTAKRLESVKRIRDPYRGRESMLRFEKNERCFDFSPEFINNFRKKINSSVLNCYPELDPFYEALAGYLDVAKENIFLGSGSEQCVKAIYESYFDSGDRLLIHSPSYAMYSVYAKIFDVILITQEVGSTLELDIKQYIKKLNANCKMAILENPNGSTGSSFSLEQIENFVSEAHKKSVLVIVDEVYHHLNNITAIYLIKKYDNLIVLRSFSKVFGAAGARIGFAVANKNIIDNLFLMRPMYEISNLSMAAGIYFLENINEIKNYVGEINDSKRYLIDEFNKRNILSRETKTNFLLFRLPDKFSGVDLAGRLKENKILIRGASSEGPLRGWARITLGTKEQAVIFLRALDEILYEDN